MKSTFARAFANSLVGSLVLLAAVAPVSAQLPDKPIKFVYPFPAGSAGDTVTRIVAHGLQTQTGRTVIVENRSGAGGITGTRSVVGGEADGSLLIVVPSAVVTMIPLYNPDTGYDARKDLTPISQLVGQDLALAVGPALPAASLKEMIAIVGKDKSKGTYGTPGAGSSLHLIGVKLAEVAKLPLTPVHYRGASLALNDVVAGQLPMMLSPLPDQIEQHRSGAIRVIATAGVKRSDYLTGVPTFTESGIDIVAMGWFAAFGPAGMPPKLVEQLSGIFAATVNAPENREKLAKLGFVTAGTKPSELGALVVRDLDYWTPIFKASGFKP